MIFLDSFLEKIKTWNRRGMPLYAGGSYLKGGVTTLYGNLFLKLLINIVKEFIRRFVKVGQFLNLIIFLDNFALYDLSEIRVFDKIGTP